MAYDYSCVDLDGLYISLISALLLLLVNFVRGFRLEFVYISHHKYQGKPHLSTWFSPACAATIKKGS